MLWTDPLASSTLRSESWQFYVCLAIGGQLHKVGGKYAARPTLAIGHHPFFDVRELTIRLG